MCFYCPVHGRAFVVEVIVLKSFLFEQIVFHWI